VIVLDCEVTMVYWMIVGIAKYVRRRARLRTSRARRCSGTSAFAAVAIIR
jgi:hypothetical protein